MKAKTKRKLTHILTKKKLVKRQTSKRVLRGFFVFVTTVCSGTLVFAVATTKPTVSAQVSTRLHTKSITFEPVVVQPPQDQSGTGSWYAFGLPAPDAITCASRTFPRGTYLSVTDQYNGRTVICLVNDYGPEAWTGRVIDLSRGSFRLVDDLSRGTIPVKIHPVPAPPQALNLTNATAFSQISGESLCAIHFTAKFCETNRQKPIVIH